MVGWSPLDWTQANDPHYAATRQKRDLVNPFLRRTGTDAADNVSTWIRAAFNQFSVPSQAGGLAAGDEGAPLFIKSGSDWQLVGIATATSSKACWPTSSRT